LDHICFRWKKRENHQMLVKQKPFDSPAYLIVIALLTLIPFFLFLGCGGGGGGDGDGDSNTFTYYLDADGDECGDPTVSIEAESQPSGYVLDNTDCDDTNENVNPGATETCNGIDDDCDDSDCACSTWYHDSDGDGFGNSNDSMQAVSQPIGYISDNRDCDDSDSLVNPGVEETCGDTIDNDCDGYIDYLDSDCEGYPSYTGTVLFFEPVRMLTTTELNGKVLENGFSFSGWFNFIQMPAEGLDIIGFIETADPNTFNIANPGDGSINIHLKGQRATISELATNEWINLSVTYDLSTIYFYINGALVETADASGPVVFPYDDRAIFAIGGLGQCFYGYITQIKIWDRGLSREELNMEINRADSSDSEGIEHQWLLNEGRSNRVKDSVGGADIQFSQLNTPYWIDLEGPYEIVHDAVLRVSNENKLLPFPNCFGSADLNQDGYLDLIYHGAFADPPIDKTPLLALQNDGAGNFSDASDSLIDGGLYYKRYPSGRETIIADFNNDGFSDIFMGQHGMHSGVGESEAQSLLLSNGDSGKVYPSEDTIMSPPCTLVESEFVGQKPCISDPYGTGDILYPDNNAPLVPVDIRIMNHGVTAEDVDNDGDIDIYIGAGVYNPVADGIQPVLSYLLLNDGNGNFIANWQMVPNKAFCTNRETNENNKLLDNQYGMYRLKDFDGDGFLDLLMLGGSSSDLAAHQPSDPFDVEQDLWDASVHDLIAWGAEGGFSEIYTILDGSPLDWWDNNNTAITTDIDMDGDIDIIFTWQHNDTGQYLQVHSNNGDRTFSDVTQLSIPQDLEKAQTLVIYSGEMREIDFNNDQCPDFYQQNAALSIHGPSNQPYIMWLNNCKGYFTPIERRFVGKMGLLIPLDADGDGDIDFVSQTTHPDGLEHTLLRRTREINMDKYIDTDRDGLRDVDDIDDDNDGVNDSEDAYPKDKHET